MEGSSQDLGVDSMGNQKIFKVVKRRKLKSAPDQDAGEDVENVSMQITTHTLENSSKSDGLTNNCGSEVTPQEFAFSIDDVFEQILNSLDRTSLLSCRQVSRRWRLSSTPIILIRCSVSIMFKYSLTDQVYVKQTSTAGENAAPKSTLEDLNHFLKDNYWPRGSFKMSEFPCRDFDFVDGSLSDPQLQSFLTTFGKYIFLLFLDFSNSSGGESEDTLIKHIGNLLNTQATDLSVLYFSPSSKLGVPKTEESHHPAVSSTESGLSPQFQNDKGQEAKETDGKEGITELIYRGGQRRLFDYIISISPNLQKISIGWRTYHFLLSPLNRLHFLDEFKFRIGEDEIFDFENFKLFEGALCVPNEERESQKLPPIKFKELSINFDNIVDYMLTNPDIRSSFVRVINKILELSWDTLEIISLVNPEDDTLNGLKWPRVLTNVSHLDFRLGTAFGSGLELFPSKGNFKIQESFPKLNWLNFNEVIDHSDDDSVLRAGEFLRNCDFGPAPSVQFVKVTVHRFLSDFCYVNDVETEDVKRLLSDVTNSVAILFPSAELTIEDKAVN